LVVGSEAGRTDVAPGGQLLGRDARSSEVAGGHVETRAGTRWGNPGAEGHSSVTSVKVSHEPQEGRCLWVAPAGKHRSSCDRDSVVPAGSYRGSKGL